MYNFNLFLGCSGRRSICDMAADDLKNKWREKRMHGKFVREIKEDINESKSWNWVKNSDLKSSTTALIFSAQGIKN